MHGRRAGQGDAERAVVAAIDGGDAGHRQRRPGDIGGGADAGRRQHVVGAVGAGRAEAGDQHRLAGAGVPVGELCARIRHRQHVAVDAVVGQGHAGAGTGVVHPVAAGGRDVQGARRDGAAACTATAAGKGDAVVGAVVAVVDRGAVEKHAAVAGAGVLVGEAERGRRHAVATDQGAAEGGQVGRASGVGGRAVIHLADCRGGQHHAFWRDHGATGGAGGQQVVVQRSAVGGGEVTDCQRSAHRAHTGIAAVETAGGLADADGVGADQAGDIEIGAGELRGGRAVIHLADAIDRHRQWRPGDGPRQTGLLADHVVAVAGSEAGNSDSLVGAGIGVGEQAAAGSEHRHHFAVQAGHHGVAAQGGGAGAVVGLGDGHLQAVQRQHGRRDIDRQAARLHQRVVGIADGVAAHTDRLAGAGVLVEQRAAAGAVDCDNVAAEGADGRRAAQHDAGAGVVDPVDGTDAGQGQQGARDVGAGAGAGRCQHVVAGVGAALADAGHRDGLAIAGILVGEAGAAARYGHHVPRDPVVGQGHAGGDAAVVDAIGAAGRDGQGARGDGAGVVAGQGHQVVGAIVAVVDGGAVQGHGAVAGAGVLVEVSHRRRRHHVAAHQNAAHRRQIAGADRVVQRAVVGLADAWRGQGDAARADGTAAAGAGRQGVVRQLGAAVGAEVARRQARRHRAGADVAAVVAADGARHDGALAIGEAGQVEVGAGERGDGAAVVDLADHAGEIGGDGHQRPRVDQQLAVDIAERVVRRAVAAGGDGVGADVDGALRTAAVADGAAQVGQALAVDESAGGDAVAAAVSQAVVGLDGVVGGDRQGLLVDRQRARRVAADGHRVTVVAGHARQVDRDGVRRGRSAGGCGGAGGRGEDGAGDGAGHRVAQVGASHRRLRAGQRDHTGGQRRGDIVAVGLADVLRADGDGRLVLEHVAVAGLRQRAAGVGGIPDGGVAAVEVAEGAGAGRRRVDGPARARGAQGDGAGAVAGAVGELAPGRQGDGIAAAAGAHDGAGVQHDVGAQAAIAEIVAAAIETKVGQGATQAISLVDHADAASGDAVEGDRAGILVGLVGPGRHGDRHAAAAGVDHGGAAAGLGAHADGGDAVVAPGVVHAAGHAVVGHQGEIAVTGDDVALYGDAAAGAHGQRAAGGAAAGVDAALDVNVVVGLQGQVGTRAQDAGDVVGRHGLAGAGGVAEGCGAGQADGRRIRHRRAGDHHVATAAVEGHQRAAIAAEGDHAVGIEAAEEIAIRVAQRAVGGADHAGQHAVGVGIVDVGERAGRAVPLIGDDEITGVGRVVAARHVVGAQADGGADQVAGVAAHQGIDGRHDVAVAACRVVRQAAAGTIDPGDGASVGGAGHIEMRIGHHEVAVVKGRVDAADLVIGFDADDTVDIADDAAHAAAAAAPGHGAGVLYGAVVPQCAEHHVVAVVEGGIADRVVGEQWIDIAADLVAGMAADQAVGRRDDVLVALRRVVAQTAGGAVDQADGAGIGDGAIVPVLVLDQIIARHRQRRHGPVRGVAGFQAQHTVDIADGASQRRATAAPGDGARIDQRAVVPGDAGNDVVARIKLIANAVVAGQQGLHADAVVLAGADPVVGDGADQAVGAGDGAHGRGAGAVAPGDGAGAQGGAIAPVAAGGDVVAIGQRDDAVRQVVVMAGGAGADVGDDVDGSNVAADPVARVAAHQAVGGADRAGAVGGGAAGAADPGDGAAAGVEHGAGNHIVAIGKRGDGEALARGRRGAVIGIIGVLVGTHPVAGAAADQAVGGGNHADGGTGAAAPGDGAGFGIGAVGPVGAEGDVVAVAGECDDPARADAVAGLAADQAVARGQHARLARLGLAGAAVDQGRGADGAAEVRAGHHVVVVGQHRHAGAADAVAGGGADHAGAGGIDILHIAAIGHPGHRAARTVPVRAADHEGVVAQQGHAGRGQIVVGVADHAVAGRYHAGNGVDAVEGGQRAAVAIEVGAVDQEIGAVQLLQILANLVGAVAFAGVVVAADVADQAVGRADHAGKRAGAAAEGDRADALAPGLVEHHIVVVGQHGDVAADLIAVFELLVTVGGEQRHGGAADQAVGRRHHAGHAGGAIAEGERTARVVPGRAADQIIAVRQYLDVGAADVVAGGVALRAGVAGGAADQAVGGGHGDGAGAPPGAAVAEGQRAAATVPQVAGNDEIAVGQAGGAAIADLVVNVAAVQG